ncbi:porin OmpC [Serratia fonticola]|uniref:porin OmpC n=1 Tax=Serratia fonticola TaxID=47917 RepID=UPI000BFB8C2A|nr:porin OmpC [Serratia fonticola]ATM78582.1 porin OmpC [Serratia fonticola]MBC3217789.1 porin OmpC [Serratia fonticola]MBC3227896.1 porin OmpC [Serratia fonticola]NCG51978.1 porin OmpC [Serratia fonticola]
MKLRVLSLMVPALLMVGNAGAAEIYNKDGNKLDLYGLVDGLHYFSDNNSVDGDQSYIRMGLRGETQINDQLTGYGTWEYQVNVNTPESENNAFTRYGFAGLKAVDYGSFDYGRNNGVLYDVAAYTDMQPEFDGSTYGADQFMFQRSNGLATYRNNDFFGLIDGLHFAVQYQGKNGSAEETNNGRDVLGQNGDGYGMSVNYDIGYGISAAGAFFNSKRTSEQNGGGVYSGIMGRGDHAEGYSGGLKYDDSNTYVAVMFTQSYNAARFGSSDSEAYGYANKAQSFEAYAHYLFDFGLRPFVGYNQTNGKNLGQAANGNTYGSENLVKFVDLGATYYLNKNMSTYVDYKINLLDENDFTKSAGINTDDVVAVGLVYQF